MPNCPQCLEEIKVGAKRCPHCQTIFETSAGTAGNTVYVVDDGLVKFAKFTLGILAIFALIGVYVFGYDIKQATEKTFGAKHEVEKAALEIERQKALMDAKINEFKEKVAQVEGVQREIGKKAAEIDEIVAALRLKKEEAFQYVDKVRVLSQGESQKASTKREERGIKAERGKLWPNGSTLRYGFLDGREQDKSIVRDAINQWAEHVNLKIEETSASESEIRISFREGGSWSYIGNDALGVPKTDPTVDYGFMARTSDRKAAMQQALHEFGHALGLLHEFQNPAAGMVFDQAAVKAFYGSAGWDEQTIKSNLYLKDGKQYPGSRPYDRESIMLYGFPPQLYLPDKRPVVGATLSEGDKKYVASLYPRS